MKIRGSRGFYFILAVIAAAVFALSPGQSASAEPSKESGESAAQISSTEEDEQGAQEGESAPDESAPEEAGISETAEEAGEDDDEALKESDEEEENEDGEFSVPSLSDYDAQLMDYYAQYGADVSADPEYEKLLLQRDLVSKTGYDDLSSLLEGDNGDGYREMLSWLFDDTEFLEMFLTGGKPGGNYLSGGSNYQNTTPADPYKSTLEAMYELWTNDREDFDNHDHNNMYRKMICCVSLTCTGNIKYWLNTGGSGTVDTSINCPQPARRYEIFKDLYSQGMLEDYFPDLEVPEMRYIFGSSINDEEIKWASNIAKERNYNTNCYSWMNYRSGNYHADKYYESDTWSDYDAKYNLASFGVSNNGYGTETSVKYPKQWIVMEEGGVCWHIANFCQNIWSSYGRPCLIAGSMGTSHEVYLAYNRQEDGRGRWTIENAQGGNWNNTHRGAYANGTWRVTRWMNDWGVGEEFEYNNGSYICMAQAAINEYDDFIRSEVIQMLADVVSGEDTKEDVYRAALTAQDFNFDAWYGLVKLYNASGNKSDEDKANLGREIAATLPYYPLPMHDLINILSGTVSSPVYTSTMSAAENTALKKAQNVTDDESLQAYAVKTIANWLLGQSTDDVATFSFDGENAGVIMLNDQFKDPEYWEYSLDGGTTWSAIIHDEEVPDDAEGKNRTVAHANAVLLSEEEIASINAEDDILIRFIQVPDTIHTIDIKQADAPSTGTVYANDWENRLIGTAGNGMEYSTDDGQTWEDYTEDITFPGDETALIRTKSYGVYTVSDSAEFSFTSALPENTDTKQYVPIDQVELYAYCSQNNNSMKAENFIDGNINTHWHNTYSGETGEYDKYYVVQFEQPKTISAIEFINYDGSNGRPKILEVYGSTDGENWSFIQRYGDPEDGQSNLPNTADIQLLTVEEENETAVSYLALIYKETYGNSSSQVNNFAAGKLLHFYEDTTRAVSDAGEEEGETGPSDPEEETKGTGDTGGTAGDESGTDASMGATTGDTAGTGTAAEEDAAVSDPANLEVSYEKVDDGIKVIITADQKLKPVEGWDLSEDETMLTRVYAADADDPTVTVQDENGNVTVLELDLTALDAEADDADTSETGDADIEGSDAGTQGTGSDGVSQTGEELEDDAEDVEEEISSATADDEWEDAEAETSAENNKTSGTKTGDSSRVMLYLVLMLASLLTAGGVFLYARRRK